MKEPDPPKIYRLTLGKDRPSPRLHDYRQPSRYPELPFDEVTAGSLVIEGHTFCLTGEFPSGRRAAEEAIVARGGRVEDHALYRTYCVIVGELPSRGWKYGNYGNKIHEAIELKKTSGHPLLLRESSWLKIIASPKTTEQHLDELPHQRERSTWLLHSFETGYSDGWACCLPAAFRPALDIRQTARKEFSEDRVVWTQGANFAFDKGDVIHDSREVHEKPWSEALQSLAFVIQVVSATPQVVAFDVLVPDAERKGIVFQKRHRATPIEFVRLLIIGSCRELD